MTTAVKSTNDDKPFEPGETIEFCDDHFVVEQNYGTTGRVRIPGTSQVLERFCWTFEGVKCTRVPS